jgi:hypothetical protein
VPFPSSSAGDQKRDEFISRLLGIAGDPRALWIPATGDTTSAIEQNRHAAVYTYDATVASRRTRRGSGWALNFNGTSHEADSPDVDHMSFGDGATDEPLSIVALVKPDDGTPAAQATILSKFNKDTDGELREWQFFLTATTGKPRLDLFDESANASIARAATTVADGAWVLLGATYDGSGAVGGINIWEDAAITDDATSTTGTYVAMENTTAIVSLGHTLSAAATPVAEEFWAGDMAFILVAARAFGQEDMWEIKALANAMFDLAL